MRGERGFALVITLIVTALLIALLAEFVNEVYVDASHSHNFVASQQASIIAESGIQGGYTMLKISALQRAGANYSTLADMWAKPFSYDTDEGTVTVTIEEETGKLNLNNATTDNGNENEYTLMAKRLFSNLKLTPELTDPLMDWADLDDTPHPSGAETSYYTTLKAPYRAKNTKLDTVEELALLKGYTPEIVAKLKPFVTVYGSSDNEFGTKINVNTAPKELLQALSESMTEDLANRIIDWRKTNPIKNLSDFNSIAGISAVSTGFVDKITFGGNVYRIHAEGKVGESTAVAEAVVRVSGSSVAPPIYWREY